MSDTTQDTTDTTTAHGTLPDREIAWDPATTTDIPLADPVATTITWARGVKAELSLTTQNSTSRIGHNIFAKIIDGADEYKTRFGEHELDIPPYYSRFADEFDTVPCKTSALGHDWGTGIDATRLEEAIRLATGDGRFSADELTITVCGEHPFLIETTDTTYVMAPATLREYNGDEIISERECAGMTITNEMGDNVLAGIERAVDVLAEQCDIQFVEHVRRVGSRHEFRSADGELYRLSGHNLNYVWRHLEDEILGEHTVTYGGEHTFTVTEDDLRYPVGSDQNLLGKILGYKLEKSSSGPTFHEPRTHQIKANPVGLTREEHDDYTALKVSDYSGNVVFDERD